MPWLWKIKQGQMFEGDVYSAEGYSGFGEQGKNRPEAASIVNIGPIPPGSYIIGGVEEDETKHGPVAIHLIPEPGTQVFHRSGFMVHGDSREHPGAASHGCIILDRKTREKLVASQKRQLLVISGNV